jgi:carbamoyl-phosphate synthase large subunit
MSSSSSEAERKNGEVLGVIVQLGGQTPLKLAMRCKKQASRSWVRSDDAIDLAEDRERFQKLLHKLKLRQPKTARLFRR